MGAAKRYLSATVSPQPLIHRWYAWPQLVSPVTAGFSLRQRQLAVLESYLSNPRVHANALADPARMTGPFLDSSGSSMDELRDFNDRIRRQAAPILRFADDIDTARAVLRDHADGGPLTDLYPKLPEGVRGFVELVYDDLDRPSVRFFETLLYRSEVYRRDAQQISLLSTPDLRQPFIFNSPLLPSVNRLDVTVPFDSPVLDELYAARWSPVAVGELNERLGLTAQEFDRFAALFTDEPPQAPLPAPESGVRMRYLGHAGVLLESTDACVLLDPIVGYAGDGIDHLRLTDLPHHIDAVVLSHAHADHVSLETLLQLRHRVDVVVVPGSSGGSVLDPGLGAMLRALGLQVVVALGELEDHTIGDNLTVTSIPFLGEHADLDIRAKMVPLIEIAGRRFLFATDTVVVEPELYRRVGDLVIGVDALFIGLECVGAPMSWLYGPLLGHRPNREHNQKRALAGSDAAMADTLAILTGAQRVYTYAMGFEPWLRHITGSIYDAESEQVKQVRILDKACAARGVPSEMLYLRGERSW